MSYYLKKTWKMNFPKKKVYLLLNCMKEIPRTRKFEEIGVLFETMMFRFLQQIENPRDASVFHPNKSTVSSLHGDTLVLDKSVDVERGSSQGASTVEEALDTGADIAMKRAESCNKTIELSHVNLDEVRSASMLR